MTSIWTDKTLIVDRGGARVRTYVRKLPGPPRRVRKEMRAVGMAWCRECGAWAVTDNYRIGLCKPHVLEDERRRYARDPEYRARRRARAVARKRGVDPVPPEGKESLLDSMDGCCAYCLAPATTWDHVVPITKGGETTPDNILPACVSCNSSKGNRDLFEWLDATGREMHVHAAERLAHCQVLPL